MTDMTPGDFITHYWKNSGALFDCRCPEPYTEEFEAIGKQLFELTERIERDLLKTEVKSPGDLVDHIQVFFSMAEGYGFFEHSMGRDRAMFVLDSIFEGIGKLAGRKIVADPSFITPGSDYNTA